MTIIGSPLAITFLSPQEQDAWSTEPYFRHALGSSVLLLFLLLRMSYDYVFNGRGIYLESLALKDRRSPSYMSSKNGTNLAGSDENITNKVTVDEQDTTMRGTGGVISAGYSDLHTFVYLSMYLHTLHTFA